MKQIPFIALVLLLSPWSVFAQTSRPTIAVTTDIEDGKKMIHALVTLNGKPLENVNLQYFVQRTFGNLPIGQDTTLDDGTSAVAFPSDLPGAPDGKLHVFVRIAARRNIPRFPPRRPFLPMSSPLLPPTPFRGPCGRPTPRWR